MAVQIKHLTMLPELRDFVLVAGCLGVENLMTMTRIYIKAIQYLAGE